MSKATPRQTVTPVLSASAALGAGLWLMVLVIQWQLPALPALIPMSVATLIILGLALLLLRRARREDALADALRQETVGREAAEAALRQSRNLAAIGRLTRGLAHDFNNHLTAISSNIELLARRLPPDAGSPSRLAEAAIQGVRRAAQLTHHLLSLSRSPTVEPEPLDIGRLIGGMGELLRRTLGEDITIETRVGDGLWLAWADPSQVEWALLDLALNARDAMPRGGTLRIAAANTREDNPFPAGFPGQWVTLEITDTGAERLDARVQRKAETIAGARISVTHKLGEGTTVRLDLPRYVTPPPIVGIASSEEHGGATILLVEDDDQVRGAAAAALRDIGYKVLEAPDAMEGFRLVADRGGIDLLFTDIGLPGGVDGKALADAARNVMPDLKVLFTTGYGRGGIPPAEENRTLFLAKPFSLDELAAKVRQALPARKPVLAADPG